MEEMEEAVYGSPAYTKHCRKLYGNKARFFSELPIGAYFLFYSRNPTLEDEDKAPKIKVSENMYIYDSEISTVSYPFEPCMLVLRYFPTK